MDVGLVDIVQGGTLAIFAWYAIQNNREWRIYLNERNSKLEKSLDKLSATLDRHHDFRK